MLITGVGSGIGQALCEILLKKNYQVLGTTRDPQKTEALYSKEGVLPENLQLLTLNLDRPEKIIEFIRTYEEKLRDVDILINNAGSGQLNALETMSWDEIEYQINVNFLSHVKLIQFMIPIFQKKQDTAIITVGSLVYYLQFPYKTLYCAAKSALSAFICSLRYELLFQGIRTHLIEPGWVRSEFHQRIPEVNEALKSSVHATYIGSFLDYSKDHDVSIPDGKAVAMKILHLIENPKAPFRIGVGNDLRLVRWLLRILPDHWVDILIQRRLNKKTKK